MKKIAFFAASLLMLGGTACNGDKTETTENEMPTEESVAIAQRDSLLILYNDIAEGMAQIRQMEMIVTTPGALGEGAVDQREQIKNDMAAIQQALQERRTRLSELEKNLAASSGDNTVLKKTIATLKAQIEEQQKEIAQLTDRLKAANVEIAQLNEENEALTDKVENLNETVAAEQQEREIAQAQSENLANELNTCYYACGSKGELKKNGILESGFLRKTKIMEGDYNLNYFTKADKRTLSTINTHSKKAEIKTNMPKDSYTITEVNKEKVITITNPERFWSLSNFLVIQTD